MILDSLKNCALYENVNPRMKKAFALIASTDWTKMEPGIHELDGWSWAIFGLCVVASARKVNPILLILLSAAAGIVIYHPFC